VIVTRRRIYSTLLTAVALCTLLSAVLAPDAFAQGCAMCGTAFIKDDPVTRAFNWSVLFLIAMPYTIFGLAAGWLFLAHRRRGRHRAEVIAMPITRQVPAPAAGPEES
jgi:ABC-type sulfate transport system permease subunit